MQRRIIGTALLLVVALAVTGCAPFTATPSAPSSTSPAPTPRRAGTATSPGAGTPEATGPGKLFAGTVRHAGAPVAGARVELRELGWNINRTPAVATVKTDDQGQFSLANPPAGDYSIIGFFPDGDMDAGGWPPVSIAPGQEITGFVVPIERPLTLLSPIAGAPAAASPTLTWKANDEAASYRVWVIDAGTTEMLLDQTTTGTSVRVPAALKPGLYQWVVNGLNTGGELVATAEETFRVPGEGEANTPTPAPTEGQGTASQPSAMPRLPDRERAFEGARAALAKRLGVDPLAIKQVEVTPQQWRDSCLGVSMGGEMCAQVITPGWIVVLEANGQRYEVHTDQQGIQVRLAGQ